MGVAGPMNFVTIVNRFPPHCQRLATLSNNCFVTIFSRNLLPQLHLHARIFRLQVVQQTSKLNRT